MTTLLVADRVELLTPDWLTAALRTSATFGSATVRRVVSEPVGAGQMSDSFRLTLDLEDPDSSPGTIIAKVPSSNEMSRSTARTLRSYENEVRFYKELATELPVRNPLAYYADMDPEKTSFVLLLEDLAPALPGDQLIGCTSDEATIAVDELVNLHAPRWGDPALADLEWLHRDREANHEFLLMLLPNLWDGFQDRYSSDMRREVQTAGSALFAHLEPYILGQVGVETIIHGDYRLDNLLFGQTSRDPAVAVVDWQTCTHGPALNDVAYFVGAGMEPELRRQVESDLLVGYHKRLLASGVSSFSWDACWDGYRRGSLVGLLMTIAASMLVERTARGDEMFLTMAYRHACHVIDLDAIDMIAEPVNECSRPSGTGARCLHVVEGEATTDRSLRSESGGVGGVAAQALQLGRQLRICGNQSSDLVGIPRAVGVRRIHDSLIEQAVEMPVSYAAVDRPRTIVRFTDLGDGRGLHVHADETVLEELPAEVDVERRLFGCDQVAGLRLITRRSVPVGRATGELDYELGIDHGADRQVGVKAATDTGDHHMVDRNVVRGGFGEQS